jgi:2-oxoglutarate ferredoxin oxidoreductase subunit alpha
MSKQSFVIRIGGESGEGIVTIGEVFVRIAAFSGLEVFTFRTFPAEIMGGHVVYQARIGRERVLSQGDQMDVLVAMNQEGFENHIGELRPGGVLVELCPGKKPDYDRCVGTALWIAPGPVRADGRAALGQV